MAKKSKKDIIVLIDPVSSGLYLKKTVVELGYRLIVVNTLTKEQVLGAGKTLDNQTEVLQEFNSRDITAIAEFLAIYKEGIIAIIGASEPAVEHADILAAKLGLRGNTPETTKYRRNKYEMRQALKQTKFVVDNSLCKSLAEVLLFAEKHSYPLVVKALDSAGNDHVYFCYNETDLEQSVNACLGAITIFGEKITELMVEEFIDGDLYAVEFFVQNQRILITAIWRIGMVDIPETRGRIFTDFCLEKRESVHQQMYEALMEIVPEIGLEVGAGLIEFKYNALNNSLKLIELSSRLSGIDLPKVQKEISDFDPFVATINCFTSSAFQLPHAVEANKIAEVYFKSIPKKGFLRKIKGLDKIEGLPSFYQAKIFCKPDSFVEMTRDQATLAASFYLIHHAQEQIDEDKRLIDTWFELEIVDADQYKEN